MKLVRLTDEQIQAIQVFLGRADLKGVEAPMLVSIFHAVQIAPEEVAPAPEPAKAE